jgi:hypothetical protein
MIPGIRFGFEHDSNIYGINLERGPVPDYSTSLALDLNTHWLAGNWLIMSLGYAPSYDFYFQVKSERAFNQILSLGARLLLFNRFPISGGYSYSRNRYRFSSEIDQRVFLEAKGYHGGINFDAPGNSSLGVSFSRSDFRYESLTLPGSEVPLSQSLDRTEQGIRFDFYLPVFSDSQFFANVGHTDYVFTEAAGAFRDSTSYQTYVGVRFPILGRARGNVAAGYKKFMPREEGQPGFSGFVANTDAELRLGRINLRVLYVRDIPFSYGNNVFYISNNYGGGISLYLGQALRIDYDYNYGQGDYSGGLDTRARTDTYISHSVGIVLRIIRTIGTGLRADMMERRSNYASQNMSRTLFGAYLTYDF